MSKKAMQFITPGVSASFRANGGGLNTAASPTSLEDNESSGLLNIVLDKFGAVKKRLGYTALNTSAFNSGAAWNGLYWAEFSSGTSYLLGSCGNKLAKMDGLDGTWDNITGALTNTAGNNNHVSFAMNVDTVLGTNNVDLPWQWTGSGNATAMTVPTGLTKAKFVVTFQGYTILLHVTVSGTTHKSRGYWSALDSISTWDSADFRDLGLNDGQEITGVAVLGDTLVVFKNRYIWLGSFTGDADIPFVFQQARSTVGCVSGQSIQNVDNGLVFLSYDGLYYFDGNNSYKLSERIGPTYDAFNKARIFNSVSTYNSTANRYMASFTDSGESTNSKNVVWNDFLNAFTIYEGLNSNCFARAFVSGEERTYFGDYSGYVYRMDVGNSDYPANVETAINAYYYSKWMDYGDLIIKKSIPEIAIYYQYNEATLTFSYSYNFESVDQYTQSFSTSSGSSVYGTAIYDTDVYAAAGGAVKMRHLTGRGEVVRFGFKNSNIGETFTIDAFGNWIKGETWQ
jgi:hypothetical protein